MAHEFLNDECEYCTVPPTEVRQEEDRLLELCELCADDFDDEHEDDEEELGEEPDAYDDDGDGA